jgi:ribose-phosphate pyrophosphokinase
VKNETALFSVDPVCAMAVDPSKAEGQAQFNGKTYYFCTPACHQKFLANPPGFVALRCPPPSGCSARAVIDPLCGEAFDPARALRSEAAGNHFQGRRRMNTLVLPAPGSEEAAAALAGHLEAAVGGVEFRRFPDGESYLRLHGELANRDVVVVASLRDPDPQALTLWYLAGTARELGARSVGLVAPYLPYMRQDRRFQSGEAVTSTIFARFLSQAFDWLVTVDPHLHRYASLAEIYSIPARNVQSAPAIARWVAAEVDQPVIVGPDSESEQWAADVAARIGCPSIVLRKRRLGDRSVEISVPDAQSHAGRNPVLIDDIISSARTMAVAVRQVRAAFGRDPLCVGVHAVFAPDALQALREAGAGRVVSCNTLPHASNGIDVLGEVATAVRKLVLRIPA